MYTAKACKIKMWELEWKLRIAFLTEAVEEIDDEAGDGENYEAKASKKKEKKRQEREARRQVLFKPLVHIQDIRKIFFWFFCFL